MGAEANQQIGDYEILGVLGSGGMGKVYRVRNVISDRVEAMKVLLPDLAGRQELAGRFLREIKLLASLNHPNIATLCTALTIDNQLVMIMEYVEGVTLDELIGQGRVSVEDGTSFICQVLAALSYAHRKGVIHRDIKPSNMMLTANHVVKLMDFGIARSAAERSMTQTGTTLGSVNYMSPEQITGQAVDARSDVYSTGISLYEIVTGQRPFNATSDYELMAMHVKESPKPPMELRPWLPSSLNEIILTAIAKDPNDRFQSADDFRNALLKAQGSAATGPVPFATEALPSARMATVVESSPSGLIVSPASVARERTQVATRGSSGAQAAQPAALANRPPAASGRRTVYIASGAILGLAAIGAPAIYLANHHASSRASSSAPPADNGGAANVAPATTAHAVPAKPAATVMPNTPHPSVAVKAQVAIAAPPVAPAPRPEYTPPPATPASATTISPELQKQLDNLELRIDTDTSHATAINNSLNTMQSQMQKDGMSLRGDVSSQQSSMNLNLSKAQKALEAHDADRADRFAGLAETDIAQLQKFLGR
jgi:hypothetical protein